MNSSSVRLCEPLLVVYWQGRKQILALERYLVPLKHFVLQQVVAAIAKSNSPNLDSLAAPFCCHAPTEVVCRAPLWAPILVESVNEFPIEVHVMSMRVPVLMLTRCNRAKSSERTNGGVRYLNLLYFDQHAEIKSDPSMPRA